MKKKNNLFRRQKVHITVELKTGNSLQSVCIF